MDIESVNWDRLIELRNQFIGNSPENGDYWDSVHTLESYDQTFAQRIGWKWDYVINQLLLKQWQPPSDSVVCDWACGTGIASRIFAEKFYPRNSFSIHFADRSRKAVKYATQRMRNSFQDIFISDHLDHGDPKVIYLISHVTTELSPDQLEDIILMLSQSAYGFIWVEPGSYASSRCLSKVRDALLNEFNPWAPCPHHDLCPMNGSTHWNDWCHQFAHVPSNVFQDGFWAYFAKRMEVDLRSLPVSYLCMDKREVTQAHDECRVVGRPQINKFQSSISVCSKGQFEQLNFLKRSYPALYKKFKKGKFPHFFQASHENGLVKEFHDLDSN